MKRLLTSLCLLGLLNCAEKSEVSSPPTAPAPAEKNIVSLILETEHESSENSSSNQNFDTFEVAIDKKWASGKRLVDAVWLTNETSLDREQTLTLIDEIMDALDDSQSREGPCNPINYPEKKVTVTYDNEEKAVFGVLEGDRAVCQGQYIQLEQFLSLSQTLVELLSIREVGSASLTSQRWQIINPDSIQSIKYVSGSHWDGYESRAVNFADNTVSGSISEHGLTRTGSLEETVTAENAQILRDAVGGLEESNVLESIHLIADAPEYLISVSYKDEKGETKELVGKPVKTVESSSTGPFITDESFEEFINVFNSIVPNVEFDDSDDAE